MLYVFGGLPGTGKTTLSQTLARRRRAVHLRIDTIEQALRAGGVDVGGPEGYEVAYRVAADNLRLGLDVVADSVNPMELTRAAWRAVAQNCGVPHVEIEVVCSDAALHRARVENRAADIDGFALPTWDDVLQRHYEPWPRPHIVIDTAAGNLQQSLSDLERALPTLVETRFIASP